MNLFIQQLFSSPWYYFSWVILVAFSICVHEYAHAWMALRCGDDTAARAGHLTLNPMVQLGPVSLGLLLVFGLAWGAVPVEPGRFRRFDGAKVAFAGPAANLGLCAGFALLAAVGLRFFRTADGDATPAVELLKFAADANGMLFVLNLLPLPLLDGWSVLGGLSPALEEWQRRVGPQVSWILLLLLIATPLFNLIWLAGGGLATRAVLLWFGLLNLIA